MNESANNGKFAISCLSEDGLLIIEPVQSSEVEERWHRLVRIIRRVVQLRRIWAHLGQHLKLYSGLPPLR